jgi:hypothetical protein
MKMGRLHVPEIEERLSRKAILSPMMIAAKHLDGWERFHTIMFESSRQAKFCWDLSLA